MIVRLNFFLKHIIICSTLLFANSIEVPLVQINNISYISLNDLSNNIALDIKYNEDRNNVNIFYRNNSIALSHNSSFILINDDIFHIYSHVRFANNNVLIPAKAFIKHMKSNQILSNIDIDSNDRLLLISSPDYNIINYTITKKGNGYFIEINTTKTFNQDMLSISQSSNNWLSLSIPQGIIDTLNFNNLLISPPISEIKTVQMNNIVQISFLLSIIPDDFDVFSEEEKIIIRLDTAQKDNAEKIKQDKKKYELSSKKSK